MLSRVSNGSVVVIDDDPAFLESLGRLLRSEGLYPRLFTSIAGLRSPNHRIVLRGFTTGHCDISMTVEAMKAGAIEFLTKPFREQDLLDGIRRAINFDRATRLQREKLADLRGRYQALTAREREVMARVVTGMLNKQIADALGITEKTVKVHRGHIMQKMRARSLADLVRTAERLGIFGHT